MKLVVVGSGTAAPTADRVCSGYWVESDDTRLLLDCGPGVVHRMAALELPWAKLDHLVITHFHNDHIGDLPMLLFALQWGVREGRSRPLTMWAPHGIQDRLRAMAAAFGDHVADPGFPVLVREVAPGDTFSADPIDIRAIATPHTDHSLAYRLDDGTASLGYTGDTGPSVQVADFAAGVDLLIAECSLPDDDAMPTHLTPSSLAAMAARARPGHLLLTHVYPSLDRLGAVDRVRAEAASAGWAGTISRATDGLRLPIEAGSGS